MKVISCIVARTTSNRLPLKVLRAVTPSYDKSMLDIIISKTKKSKLTDKIYLCTSDENCDDILVDTAERNEISIYRGAADAVIERLVSVAKNESADYIVRITGDNIFVAGEYIDEQVNLCIENELDYCRLSGVPIGATAEVIKSQALFELYETMDISVSEYLMLYIFDPTKFRCGVIKSIDDMGQYSITVDTPQDLTLVKDVIGELGSDPDSLSLINICKLFKEKRELFKKISLDTEIKLPYDKTISFGDFIKEQKKRVESSQCVIETKMI
ncbi:hypothetical protein D8S93_09340 [Vibrio sp. VGrn 2]|uniref:cytidylyltransferase domain-containing protein n=1 Tax=Vibrio sp. VGrn 2 TaxID=2419839 RepID=UPI00128CADA2|nr:hypothetical protein [Vibrio sp. VGrn 2]MPS38836.1 hypothetical protein [Vibrio sp. VGrn 2]